MTKDQVLLSPQGLKRIQEELDFLKTVRRREIAEKIRQAREFGDINENAEFEEAKNEQAFMEGRILHLESVLQRAEIVASDSIDRDKIHIGSRVTLRDVSTGDVFEYSIVGSLEADPARNMISYQSPVGKAVFGQSAGTTVKVRLPGGVAMYEIMDVSWEEEATAG